MRKVLLLWSLYFVGCGEFVSIFYDVDPLDPLDIIELSLFDFVTGKTSNFEGEWILIYGGSFIMGSEEDYENLAHRVEVRDFYISKTEVTVGQYRKCVEAGVCSKPASCNWTDSIEDKENHPINCVDWNQARIFAKWIGGDLPSEVQWEYAARSGGRAIKYPWGNTEPTCNIANFYYSDDRNNYRCDEGTTPVCSKTAGNTSQGLCDMGGNVQEWVLDEWHESYSEAPSDDIAWCSDMACIDTLANRVNRGGGWSHNALNLRSANRGNNSPNFSYNDLGFRVQISSADSITP